MRATCIMNKILYDELFLINKKGKVVSCGHHEGIYGSGFRGPHILNLDTRQK
jgi:hypothetical protein